MIDRIKEFLGLGGGADRGRPGFELAAAALLVEAATLDGPMGKAERARILDLLAHRFTLTAEDSRALLAEAEKAAAASVQILGFTRVIKDGTSPAERVRMIEMLWEVVYADGHLDDYEANLIRRVTGLLFVSDHESGEARHRAMERLGLGGRTA